MVRAGLSPTRVVAVAAEVADEIGFDHLTLAAVAQRCGVQLPSLYKHVDGLDGLRRDLAAKGVDELADAVGAAVMGKVKGDALRAMADSFRAFARRRPGLYAATVRAPDPADDAHLAASRRAVAAMQALVGSYGIDGDDAVHAIRMVRAALHGFVVMEAAGGFGMPNSVDESFRRLVDVLDRGLHR